VARWLCLPPLRLLVARLCHRPLPLRVARLCHRPLPLRVARLCLRLLRPLVARRRLPRLLRRPERRPALLLPPPPPPAAGAAAAAGPTDVPLERIDEEWTTTPNAPPSAQSHQPGKPLDDDIPTYRDDKRPLARRGAWRIGEPEISPGKMPTGERIAPWLPKGSRKYAAVLFAAMLLMGVFVGGAVKPMVDRLMGNKGADEVTLLIRTVPAGATVELAGKALEGTTPMAIDVPLDEGEHKLSFTLGDDGDKVATAFKVAEGQTFVDVEAALLESGEVEVKSRPKGASILIDGKTVGETPATIDVAYDTVHKLELKLDGYKTETRTIGRERPQSQKIKVTLQKKGGAGEVVLLSNPVAEVLMNGKLVGRTGTDTFKVPYGEHDVSLRVPSLGVEAEYTITVPERGVGRYYFDLGAGG
jgi:hypothetical protein